MIYQIVRFVLNRYLKRMGDFRGLFMGYYGISYLDILEFPGSPWKALLVCRSGLGMDWLRVAWYGLADCYGMGGMYVLWYHMDMLKAVNEYPLCLVIKGKRGQGRKETSPPL